MISFTVRMKFPAADMPEIRKALEQLTLASRQEPGCVTYTPHVVESEPDTVVIYEQYRDADALEAHRLSPHFDQYATNGLYRKMRERHVETLLALL